MPTASKKCRFSGENRAIYFFRISMLGKGIVKADGDQLFLFVFSSAYKSSINSYDVFTTGNGFSATLLFA